MVSRSNSANWRLAHSAKNKRWAVLSGADTPSSLLFNKRVHLKEDDLLLCLL